MREIRWANLGWVYQVSPPSARPQSDAMPSGRQSRNDFTPEIPIQFPKGLADLCSIMVSIVPWGEIFNDDADHGQDGQSGDRDHRKRVTDPS